MAEGTGRTTAAVASLFSGAPGEAGRGIESCGGGQWEGGCDGEGIGMAVDAVRGAVHSVCSEACVFNRAGGKVKCERTDAAPVMFKPADSADHISVALWRP